MTNKANKKASTDINWPTSHFTIADLQECNTDIINVTLRFWVQQALDKREIVEIGKLKPSIGRPRKVFIKANPTKELLEAATAAGVFPLDSGTVVPVTEVKMEKTAKATVVPVAAASVNGATVSASSS